MQKTNFKTRLLALLTAAFMIVMCVPFAAFAATTNPAEREKIVVNFAKDGNATSCEVVENGTRPCPPPREIHAPAGENAPKRGAPPHPAKRTGWPLSKSILRVGARAVPLCCSFRKSRGQPPAPPAVCRTGCCQDML